MVMERRRRKRKSRQQMRRISQTKHKKKKMVQKLKCQKKASTNLQTSGKKSKRVRTVYEIEIFTLEMY